VPVLEQVTTNIKWIKVLQTNLCDIFFLFEAGIFY